jgi:hypothetical protein
MVKSFTKSTSKIFILAILNMLVFKLSTEIDIEQVLKDIKFLNLKSDLNPTYIFTSVSIFISLTTLSMVRFFKPFIDIYLMYYLRINFYLLTSLLSLSIVYIVLRIYGYSRFYLLIYLIASSICLHLFEKYKI